METKKIIAILLATMITIGTFGTTFADDDRYEDDDKYDRYEKYEDDDKYEDDYKYEYKDKYINPSDLPEKVKDYISANYTSTIVKAELDDNEIEVKLRDWTEVKFYSNWDFKYHEIDDDDKYKYQNTTTTSIPTQTRINQNNVLKEQYKFSFKAKLWNKLDDISKTKLETIIILIDTKVLELETDTAKTIEQKERLVAIYTALKELIQEKISETDTESIFNELFN